MATSREKDACDLLDADHRADKKLFKQFEEEIFYPALRAAIRETDLLAEAEVA